MRRTSIHITSFLLVVLCSICNSQNEANKWYFAYQAGLDFNTNPPSILTNGRTHNTGASACISNNLGNLLFYTQGDTVWNNLHQIMANGTGLSGYNLNYGSPLIIKKPGNNSLWYIFTLGNYTGTVGLNYSIVDMSLALGTGSVTIKNLPLYTGPIGMHLSAVKHCNGNDFWLVVSDYNTNFISFLISPTGVNSIPVISPGGYGPTINSSYNGLRISPNGKKIARSYSIFNGSVITAEGIALYDFDNSTGIVTNSLSLISGSFLQLLGCEFSSDGSKLYTVKTVSNVAGPPLLYQWNLCAGTSAAIIASIYTVMPSIPLQPINNLQLAPNGKIYGSVVNQTSLCVINNPNIGGTGCNFSYLSQSISSGLSRYGLPNFCSSYFDPPLPLFTYTIGSSLSCPSASFTCPGFQTGCSATNNAPNSFAWNFGDPGSGPSNVSTLVNPSHNYSAVGNYTAALILYYNCRIDTVKQVINITQPCISVTSSSITCASLGSATVSTSGGIGPYTYTWLPTAQNGSVASGLSPGTYTLLVFDVGNNVTSSITTVFTSLIPLTGNVSTSNSISCFGANSGTGSVTGLAGGSGNQSYLWTNGISTYTTAFTNSLSAGIWSVNVTDALTGCQINQSFFITQPPALNLSLSANTPTTCAGSGIVLTGTNSGGTPGYTYTWTNGPPINTNTVTEFIAGTYVYTINSSDANNCLTSNTISVDFIPNPILTVSNASICPLTVGTMTALGASSYTWASTTLSLTGASFTASPLVNTQYTVIGSALGCTSVAYPTIILYPIPMPVFTSNSPRCNGQNLQLNASGGVGYSFDGPQSFVSSLQSPVITAATPLYSGVYNLTVTSVNGCTASTSKTLTVNPSPTVSALGSTVCTSQNMLLFANSVAGAIYNWSGPFNFISSFQNPTLSSPSLNQSGTYTVKVTAPSSCTNSAFASISVISPPSLTVVLSSHSLCSQAFNGSPNTITLTSFGAASYTLYTPNIIASSTPVAPSTSLFANPPFSSSLAVGIATLQGSNGVCTSSATMVFTVVPNPTVGVNSFTPVICAGQHFTYTSNGANSYTWSSSSPNYTTYSNGGVAVAHPSINAVFSVFGSSLGCNSALQTTSITVNPLPTVSITPNNPSICLGDKINLTALGNSTSFDWSPNLALNTTTGAVVSASPVSQQTYQVMASLNSCTQIARVTVSIIPLPIPEITLPKTRICLNDVITLIGKGGDTYNWTGPDNLLYAGQTVSFVAHSLTYGGTYILNVTDGNNCKNKTTADLIVDDLPYGSLIPSSKYNCVPFTSEFVFDSHTKPTTYWTLENNSYTGNKFSHLFTVPSEYLITGRLQDTNSNCINTVTILVNAYPVPKADFKFLPEKPVESLETVIFTNNSKGDFQNKWNWFFIANNGFKSNNENASYFFQDAGLYPVAFIVQNKYGCSDTIVKTIKVESYFNIYIPNAFTPNGDELNDVFLPILRGTKFYTLSIFDRWGAKLFETNNTETGWDGSYKGEEAKQDVYVWKITVSSNSGEQKVLTGQVTLNR